jgi:hypothetical protein
MVGEGKGMKEKIAEIIKPYLFLNYKDAYSISYDVEEITDQILALFTSNPLWKDIDRNIPSLEKREDDYHTGLAQGYKQGKEDCEKILRRMREEIKITINGIDYIIIDKKGKKPCPFKVKK